MLYWLMSLSYIHDVLCVYAVHFIHHYEDVCYGWDKYIYTTFLLYFCAIVHTCIYVSAAVFACHLDPSCKLRISPVLYIDSFSSLSVFPSSLVFSFSFLPPSFPFLFWMGGPLWVVRFLCVRPRHAGAVLNGFCIVWIFTDPGFLSARHSPCGIPGLFGGHTSPPVHQGWWFFSPCQPCPTLLGHVIAITAASLCAGAISVVRRCNNISISPCSMDSWATAPACRWEDCGVSMDDGCVWLSSPTPVKRAGFFSIHLLFNSEL